MPRLDQGPARVAIATLCLTSACQASDQGPGGHDDAAAESSGGLSSSGEDTTGGGTTGTLFDTSLWVGRYHVEHPELSFGELGDPQGNSSLINFEIFREGRATLVHDDCTFEEPIITRYEWFPSEDGWMTLRPGPGETSLRFGNHDPIHTLRADLIAPCGDLQFEIDGAIETKMKFHPGESCWVDRCSAPHLMQIDYCPGEEPLVPCP